MKKIILLIFCFSVTKLFAQNTIKGTIYDQNNEPVYLAFVNVFNDSVLISRVYSEKAGLFSLDLESGIYKFQIGFFETVGLDTLISVDRNIDLGKIAINTSKELDEITISERKNIITQKADRMVYNVANDKFTEGRSALEAIARAPRITVNKQQKTISMSGRNGVKILLDGRLQDDATARDIIQNLRAEDIESIEVIPIPPSKYSASENYGMINIVTKNSKNYGFSGNADLEYDFINSEYDVCGGLTLNYRSKKLEIKVGIEPEFDNITNESVSEYRYTDSLFKTSGYYSGPDKDFSTHEIIKFRPNDKVETGVVFDYYKSDVDMTDRTVSSMSGSKNDFIENSVSKYSIITKILNFSAYADYNFSSDGKKVSLTYNFTQKDMDEKMGMNSDKSGNLSDNKISWLNKYRVGNPMLDFYLPFGKTAIETGVSGLFINNDNNVSDVSSENFNYTEQTYAAYVSASRKFGEKVSVKLGLRYETADINGKIKDYDVTFDNKFSNFFPTVNFAFQPNDDNSFTLSYTKRISRPGFPALNPFRVYKNATSYSVGNPEIQPQFFHIFEASYTFNDLYVHSWLMFSNDKIITVERITPEGLAESKSENGVNEKQWGAGADYMLYPADWLEISLSANAKYRSFDGCKKEFKIEHSEGWGGEFESTIDFYLNPSQTLSAEVYVIYYTPHIGFNGAKEENSTLTCFSLAYDSPNDKFSVSVFAMDIFNQNFSRATTRYKDYEIKSTYWAFSKYFGVSLSYKFGKQSVKDVNKFLKVEGKNRM